MQYLTNKCTISRPSSLLFHFLSLPSVLNVWSDGLKLVKNKAPKHTVDLWKKLREFYGRYVSLIVEETNIANVKPLLNHAVMIQVAIGPHVYH